VTGSACQRGEGLDGQGPESSDSKFNRAKLQVFADRIEARTVEVPLATQVAVDAAYEFTRGLDLIDVSYGDRYWELHKALETQGN
jgi:hypothetical protein